MRATNHFGGLDVALQGAVDVVPLLGAIVGCHCSVPWLGRVTTNFGGVDVAPLQGAIAGCHCSVLWWGEGDDELWGSGRGAIAGCHCMVPLQGAIEVCYGGGRVTTIFGGVGVVPLQGAIAGCHCRVPL